MLRAKEGEIEGYKLERVRGRESERVREGEGRIESVGERSTQVGLHKFSYRRKDEVFFLWDVEEPTFFDITGIIQ